MTNQINLIVEHLFHKKRLDDVSVYEIERFIATHPYFAAGHFLLAKKTKQTDPEQAHDKIATTLLYYNNPLWLQWLLDCDITENAQNHDKKEPVVSHHPEHIHNDTDISVGPDRDDETIQAEANGIHHDVLDQNEEIIEAPASAVHEDEITNDIVPGVPDEFPETFPEPELTSEPEAREEDKLTPESAPSAGFSQPADADVDIKTASPDDEHLAEPNLQTNSDDDNGGGYDHSHDTGTTVDTDQPEQQDAEDEESRATAASIERTLTTATLIPTRAEIERGDFTFEPYHTIDYFASQGIKLQQSDLSRDKFGKQLKSFTEWLKSMKRLPQAVAEANMDEATQQSIQRIAEHSFEEKEIVTETMAEVWIKQGNKEKAIATLHKLSLLNPSKSHYFAAKIEQLKVS